MPNRFFFPLCAAVLALFCAGCEKAEPSRAEFVIGTVCTITLYDEAKAGVYHDIFSRLREIENRMSLSLPETDLRRVNAAAGRTPVEVHDDVFMVIQRALVFAELSGGAFDPTVGPLVSLWGIGSDNPRVPSQTEIDSVLPLINWRDIELDEQRQSVFLKRPGMALDLGAIAKGYAADEAAAIIRAARLKRAIIDLGGNILTFGRKRDKSPWKIGVQNPVQQRGAYIGLAQTSEEAVVTSGVYERYFENEGIRYHHLFSPFTGYPAKSELLSVTIIAPQSVDADALSTAVFVLGYEKGRALIESVKDSEAIFVFEDMTVRKTEGANFTLTDDTYRLVRD